MEMSLLTRLLSPKRLNSFDVNSVNTIETSCYILCSFSAVLPWLQVFDLSLQIAPLPVLVPVISPCAPPLSFGSPLFSVQIISSTRK